MGSPIAQTSTSLLQTKERMGWKEFAWRFLLTCAVSWIIASGVTFGWAGLGIATAVIAGIVFLGWIVHWAINRFRPEHRHQNKFQPSTSLLQTKVRMDWKEFAISGGVAFVASAIIAGFCTDPILTLKVLGVILGLVLLGVLGYALIRCIIRPLQQQQRQLNGLQQQEEYIQVLEFR